VDYNGKNASKQEKKWAYWGLAVVIILVLLTIAMILTGNFLKLEFMNSPSHQRLITRIAGAML